MSSDDKKITNKTQWDNIYLHGKIPRIPDTKSWLGRQIYTTINKHFKKVKTKKFIEAGCAPGEYGVYFAKSFGYEIFGFDYSREGVLLTKSNWNMLNIKGDVVEADVYNLPDYYQNYFDVVFSAGFIEHFKDPQEIINIFHSLLKENGLIVTIIPNTCNCLNSSLKKTFANHDYIKMKKTHIPIDFDDLLKYHSNYKILCAKRIVGFFPDSIFSYNNVLSKIAKKILTMALIIPARLNMVLQYNYFSSHFMIIGKKVV